MAEWLSALELAGLPGVPGTRNKVNDLAKSEAWLSRPRQGRGGGREYHVSSLPEETRAALGLAQVAALTASPASPSAANANRPALLPPVPKGGDRKAAARLAVLAAAGAFIAGGGYGVRAGKEAFCRAYGAGEVPVEPWVREIVPGVSPRTLDNWRNHVDGKSYDALADRRGRHRRGTGAIDRTPALRDYIVGTLAQIPHANAAQIHMLVENWLDGTDEDVPSVHVIRRFVRQWKEDNEAVFLAHRDPDAFRSKFGAAFGSASAGVTGPNQVWELDSTRYDGLCAEVLCPNGRRYAIVGCIDVWSRRTKFLVAPTSCATAILLLLRVCILDWGVPALVKTDNGSDYKSKAFVRGLVSLGIGQRLCPPYTPEGKPHVERVIGTMLHQLAEIMPGFIGHNVAQRKEIENRRSFAERMEKKRPQLRPIEIALTAEELQARLDLWCDTVYGRRPHGGLKGVSPFEKAATWRGPVSRIADERALDVLLAEAPGGDGMRRVTKRGVKVGGDHFIAPELVAYAGARVQVRLDPADMGQVLVYAAEGDGRFVCVARNAELLGADRAAVAVQAKRLQRQIVAEGKRELSRAARAAYRDGDVAKRLLGNAAEAAEVVVAIPAPAVAHATPALDAAADAARVLDRRGPPAAPLSDALRARREALAAEMRASAPAQSTTSSDRRNRFERALKIEAAISRGAPVPDADWDWLRGYQQTPEYRAQKGIHDDLRGGALRVIA